MKKNIMNNGIMNPNILACDNCPANPPPIECTDLELIQVSELLSQEIREVLMPIKLSNVEIQVGNAISFESPTSTFIISEPGIYEISFKVSVIKTDLATPDVGVLLIENGNLVNFNSYVRYTIGRIATISLVSTSYIQVSGLTRVQLMTGAMYSSYSSCFVAIKKIG